MHRNERSQQWWETILVSHLSVPKLRWHFRSLAAGDTLVEVPFFNANVPKTQLAESSFQNPASLPSSSCLFQQSEESSSGCKQERLPGGGVSEQGVCSLHILHSCHLGLRLRCFYVECFYFMYSLASFQVGMTNLSLRPWKSETSQPWRERFKENKRNKP